MSLRRRSRTLPALAALVLVPGSVLALGQAPIAATPAAASAAPPTVVPDGATASTSAGLLGVTVADVGLPAPLPEVRAARVDVAPAAGRLGAASPRVRASASNLGADALGIDLSGLLSQAQQTAPPDHAAPATGPQVAEISAPPIIDAGVSSSLARARLAADGSCPAPGTPLSTSTVSTADVSVLDLGAIGALVRAPGTVSTTQSVRLAAAAGADDVRAVASTATTDLAALTLFDDITVGVSQDPVLTATATGRPGGAEVTYSQPVVTVTAPGVPGSPFVLDAANETARFALPDNPLLQLELALGALTRTVATDGTSASGSAALLHVDLALVPILGDGVDIARVDVAPLSATAGAPAGGVTCTTVAGDSDGDGLTDDQEADLGTDPADADSDDDGLTDGTEVNTTDTDPLDADSDDGGIDDGTEVDHGTDPNNGTDDVDPTTVDADDDGLSDDQEADLGTDPADADSDDDGLTDGTEVNTTDTDPLDADSDDGGVDDGTEVQNGTDPTNGADDAPAQALDTDGDGLTDAREEQLGTDPTKPDTDGDGLRDGEEVDTYATDPLDKDTDGGGVTDGAEVARGSDPKDPSDDNPAQGGPAGGDADGDGLSTAQEAQHGTQPGVADTDGDGLTDGAEVNVHGTDPRDPDSDDDRISDGHEVTGVRVRERFEVCGRKVRTSILVRTDPLAKDTDRDGLTDGFEVRGYTIKQRVKTREGSFVIGRTRSNPVRKDSDRDGLRDKVERTGTANKRFGKHRTDPTRCDTDRGGVSDGKEVKRRSDPSDFYSGPRSPGERRMRQPGDYPHAG